MCNHPAQNKGDRQMMLKYKVAVIYAAAGAVGRFSYPSIDGAGNIVQTILQRLK
jgi:hypothetical protein